MTFNKPLIKDAYNIVVEKSTEGKEPKVNGNTVTVYVKTADKTIENNVLYSFIRALSAFLLKNQRKNYNIELDPIIKLFGMEKEAAWLIAIILIRFDNFIEPTFNCKTNPKVYTTNVICSKKYAKELEIAKAYVQASHWARQFQIMPTNYLGIKEYCSQITKLFKGLNNKNVKVHIMTQSEILKEKMELLHAVNKGSDEPTSMVVIEYLNNPNNKNKIVLVGKGIMQDTGGYELKPAKHMKGMNQDMTGSAVAFGTLYGLVKTKAKVNAIALLPLAKNVISDRSLFVNDIYKACNGRSVEILNPDAEGRLILADAIAYASKKYKPTSIISVATLTGLSSIVFGDYTTPFWIFGDQKDKFTFEYSAALTGEAVHHSPWFDDYFAIINTSSKIADCTNHWAEQPAGNGLAAAFLYTFAKCNTFMHLDIAGTNEFNKYPVAPLVVPLILFIQSKFYEKQK